MNLVPIYHLLCPCGHRTELPRTILVKIIQHRLVPDTDAPFLVFVCGACKAATRHEFGKLPSPGVATETPDRNDPIWFSLTAGCDENNCDSLVELIAVRRGDTTEQQWRAEVPEWKLDGIFCENHHQIVLPDEMTSI